MLERCLPVQSTAQRARGGAPSDAHAFDFAIELAGRAMTAQSSASDVDLGNAAERERQRAALLLAWMPAILHRLNNLTGVVLGMADLVCSAETDSVKRDRLAMVRDQAQTMADLLRTLGSTVVGRGEPEGLHDLADLVREVAEFRDTIAKTQLATVFEPQRGLSIVRAHPDALRWLLAALFHAGSPALAWPRNGGERERVRVRIRGDRSRVVLLLCFGAEPSASGGGAAERAREPDVQELARLAELASELRGKLGARRCARTWCARLTLEGLAAPSAV